MKILIVAATRQEIEPLEAFLSEFDQRPLLKQHAVELLITGIGGVFTAFHLGKMLQQDNWDLAINLGICGCFNREIPIGTTLNITADTFGDLGAVDGSEFLDAFDLQWMDADRFPFTNGWLINQRVVESAIANSLPRVKALSVNTVSGNDHDVERLTARYHADAESMEGAAFMWCCLKESIPFLQMRAVSNYVEQRRKLNWDIPLAIKNLNATAISMLKEYLQAHNG